MSEKVKLIKMVRAGAPEGEPKTADVHPDEEANYAAGGWVRAAEPESKPAQQKEQKPAQQ